MFTCSRRLADGVDGAHASRAILHIDADTFFLSVHAREDPTLLQNDAAVALWQYNDVVCASQAARRIGVRKHQTPEQAKALLAPVNGRLVHAYWREWPGPRIWYGPYHAASRQLFTALRSALRAVVPEYADLAIFERASIDEAYLDVTQCCLRLGQGSSQEMLLLAAEQLAQDLHRELGRSDIGLPVTIGVAANKLCSKLASSTAKREMSNGASGCHVRALRNEQDLKALLQRTPANKLPGLGSKGCILEGIGAKCIADLQNFSAEQLQASLQLTADAAKSVANQCKGIDTSVVKEVVPQSAVVTTWLAHDYFSLLASKVHTGRGGPAVMVGEWLFEPHNKKGKSNDTRVRWVLLALALDLEERLCHHVLSYRQVPTRLTITWQGPGHTLIPGHGHKGGPTHSRSVTIPRTIFAKVDEHSVLRNSVRFMDSGPEDKHVISPESLFVEDSKESANLEASDHGRRVSILVSAAAQVLCAWTTELPNEQRVAQLSLTASHFQPQVGEREGLGAFFKQRTTTHAVHSTPTSGKTSGPKIATQSTMEVIVLGDDSIACQSSSPTTGLGHVQDELLCPPLATAQPSPVLTEAVDDLVVVSEVVPVSARWPCRACTFLNAAEHPCCEMCGTVGHDAVKEVAQTSLKRASEAGAAMLENGYQEAKLRRVDKSLADTNGGIRRYLAPVTRD